jgi:glycerol-3-phosphate acyltransferase PlsY
MISSSLSSLSSFPPWLLLFSALIGYTLGAFPTAYFVVRLVAGKNVLDTGSGRVSSANALRAGGRLAFVITIVSDIAKGAVAMLLVRTLTHNGWAEAMAGMAAVVGHNASLILWLVAKRFGGGAGAATFGGGALLLWPPAALIVVPLIPLVLYFTGYASVASTVVVLTTALIFTVRSFLGLAPWSEAVYALGGSLIVIYTLRPNYQRLRAGTERRIGPRAKQMSEDQSTTDAARNG